MKKQIKHIIPNALSVFRIGIAITLFVLVFIAHPLLLGQVCIVVGIISDKLDGTLARLWNTTSERGKQLESVADPIFSLTASIYVLRYFDLPPSFFVYAVALLLIASAGRLLVQLSTGKFFYEKSPITRYGVGLIYLTMFLYIFSVPYREWMLIFLEVYGMLVFLNYWRMMIRFWKRERTVGKTTEVSPQDE